MQLELKTLAIALAVLVCCGLCYFWGYQNAETKGQLELEQYKLSQKEANIAEQKRVRNEYEKKIKNLNADLERARSSNDERLRQLERFNNTNRDLEACTRDRGDLAKLAVTGERLLREAESYIRALKDSK